MFKQHFRRTVSVGRRSLTKQKTNYEQSGPQKYTINKRVCSVSQMIYI